MDSDCREYLAHAERDKGNLDGAIARSARLGGRSADLSGTHFLLGMALEKMGNEAGAMEGFRQAAGLAAGW
jgi:Flp pilus assembly protein TadD